MSPRRRYHRPDKGSFFGDMVYDRVIPRDHLLVALESLVHGRSRAECASMANDRAVCARLDSCVIIGETLYSRRASLQSRHPGQQDRGMLPLH